MEFSTRYSTNTETNRLLYTANQIAQGLLQERGILLLPKTPPAWSMTNAVFPDLNLSDEFWKSVNSNNETLLSVESLSITSQDKTHKHYRVNIFQQN
jgi:hypothetical protein